jgi:hypothetical protein
MAQLNIAGSPTTTRHLKLYLLDFYLNTLRHIDPLALATTEIAESFKAFAPEH